MALRAMLSRPLCLQSEGFLIRKPQTEDKVHGISRGFFYAKVPQTQYLSGIEALFVL